MSRYSRIQGKMAENLGKKFETLALVDRLMEENDALNQELNLKTMRLRTLQKAVHTFLIGSEDEGLCSSAQAIEQGGLMSGFNFNEWAALYAVDPAAFEAKKEAVLTRLVLESNRESRLSLEQTLFRIRMTSKRAKSPLQAAMESSKLMWESFGKLREKLDELNAQLDPAKQSSGPNSLQLVGAEARVSQPAQNPMYQATVLQFRASGKPAH